MMRYIQNSKNKIFLTQVGHVEYIIPGGRICIVKDQTGGFAFEYGNTRFELVHKTLKPWKWNGENVYDYGVGSYLFVEFLYPRGGYSGFIVLKKMIYLK